MILPSLRLSAVIAGALDETSRADGFPERRANALVLRATA
jgi:hypothetical protein